jgi:hypothetical protein
MWLDAKFDMRQVICFLFAVGFVGHVNSQCVAWQPGSWSSARLARNAAVRRNQLGWIFSSNNFSSMVRLLWARKDDDSTRIKCPSFPPSQEEITVRNPIWYVPDIIELLFVILTTWSEPIFHDKIHYFMRSRLLSLDVIKSGS